MSDPTRKCYLRDGKPAIECLVEDAREALETISDDADFATEVTETREQISPPLEGIIT